MTCDVLEPQQPAVGALTLYADVAGDLLPAQHDDALVRMRAHAFATGADTRDGAADVVHRRLRFTDDGPEPGTGIN